MSLQNSIVEFDKIIKTLRGENGCPWDREQTHTSLRPCIMEEAAELQAAIRIYEQTQDAGNMKEELGDLLLQVVMQSAIAEEEGLFTLEEVIRGVQEKMIRRHPHVFGDMNVNNSGEVLKNWEEIKKKEKETQTWSSSPLKDIPKELPSLTRAAKTLKKIDKLYDNVSPISKTKEEILKSAEKISVCEGNESELIFEAGNLLVALSKLAMQMHLPTEQILNDRIDDMIDRYES